MNTAFACGDGRFNQMMSRGRPGITGFHLRVHGSFRGEGTVEYLSASGQTGDTAQKAEAKRLMESC